MDTQHPIDFCPAAACAAAIVRLEGFIAHISRLRAEALLAQSSELARQIEAISEELILAADEARDRLGQVQALSAAGAMAQLLAAIRDIRVRDDAERVRAQYLETRAVSFLAEAGLFGAPFCGQLSQTRFPGRPAPTATKPAPSAAYLPAAPAG